jgi:tRNA(Ile)-lysidine synthase
MADARRAIREWAKQQSVDGNPLYLVALSGGGDSLALAWAAARELPTAGFRVGAIVVDHQLQAESAQVGHRAAELASEWGLSPVILKTVRVGKKGGPEEAARNARYEAFSEAIRESSAAGVLLAHTEDDQAETVLLGLARGSGPASLKGMAAQDGIYSRPFLRLSRATLRQALADAGIQWWEDPHNLDERYARVRVRTKILPLMEQEIGPGIPQALARTADLFRTDSEALEHLATELFARCVHKGPDGSLRVEASALEAEPTALSSRVLRMMVLGVGGSPPTYVHLGQMMALIHSWRGQSLATLGGANVERRDGVVHVWPTS